MTKDGSNMNKTRILKTLCCLIVCLMTVTACGSDSNTHESPASGERSSESAETENEHSDESSMISQTEAVEEPVISEESSMDESSEKPDPPEEIKITAEPHRFIRGRARI